MASSILQETTQLPCGRDGLQGDSRIDTMSWGLALKVTWGGKAASQSCWRGGGDTI